MSKEKKYFEWIDIEDETPDTDDFLFLRIAFESNGKLIKSFSPMIVMYNGKDSKYAYSVVWHDPECKIKHMSGKNVIQFMRLPCNDWYEEIPLDKIKETE